MPPSLHRLESLASPAFIASLALLVVNDAALKPLFHNAFTGKLSDFAGLFALTLFAATLWPPQRRVVGAAIAAAFAFWKTSYAGPLIESLNAVSPFALGRTVDLTDLLALPVIPLAVWAAPRLKPWPLPKTLQLGLAAFALVAFTATSRARYVARDTMDVTQAVVVDEAALQGFLDDVADERGLHCQLCVPLSEGRVYVPEGDSDVRALIVELDEHQTLLFTVSGYDRRRGVRSLARHLRREIEQRFPDIAVIDTTADFITVVEGETTIFMIRVPSAERIEDAKQALSSITAGVARAHRLDTDAAAEVHYVRSPSTDPEYQDFVLVPVADGSRVLLVRLIRRSQSLEELHRAVTEDLAARLDAEFGPANVTMHHVSAPPLEYVF